MRNLEQHITQYAAYHRDRRNIATHFVGIPMIVFGVILALVYIRIGAINMGMAAAGFFILGWVIQFIGHQFEGLKPAFVDDIIGLAIGPLFVMTELFFMLGAKAPLKKYVEDRVGPLLAARNGALIGPASRAHDVSPDA